MIRLGLRTPAGEPWSATATTRLRRLAEEEGLLCSEGANCLLFLPRLTITSSDCEEIGDLLNRAFERAEASRGHGL
jgi:adenosylmethionine-8-amino-7-oxononanoate aminotransferase